MTGSDIAISVENLSKSYLVGHESARGAGYQTLRETLVRNVRNFGRAAADMAHGRQIIQGDEIEEFWALKDVSFEVRRGEVLGIIGRNGAGKSTLLKVLSRITEPTRGRATIRGRVASLLEVGTGFHPELTGRENIFLNGAILGMTKREIKAKFDEIVDFAEVEKFLDTPVKRYSSGMYVRLAFAVAAHLEPEILVVDEVLAVGDAQFQSKCLGKMQDVAAGGRTVLIVSHNMPMVRNLCSRAIVLSAGMVTGDTSVDKGIEQYLIDKDRNASETALKDREDRMGDGRLRFTDAYVAGPTGTRNVVRMGEPADIVLSFSAKEPIKVCNVSIHIDNMWDQPLLRLATREMAEPFSDLEGEGRIICSLPKLLLLPGKYWLLMAASVPPAWEYLDYISHAVSFDVVEDDIYGTGRVPDHGVFYSQCEWKSDGRQNP